LLGFLLACFAVGRFFVAMQRFSRQTVAYRKRFPLACPDCSPGPDADIARPTVRGTAPWTPCVGEIVAIAISASAILGAYLLATTMATQSNNAAATALGA
jgi:hypothetical protein